MSPEVRNCMHICLEESSQDPKSPAIKKNNPFGNVHTYSCTCINTPINFAFIHIIFPGKYVRGTSQVSGNRQALLIDRALPHRVWSNRGSVKKTDQVKQTTEAQNCDVKSNTEFL